MKIFPEPTGGDVEFRCGHKMSTVVVIKWLLLYAVDLSSRIRFPEQHGLTFYVVLFCNSLCRATRRATSPSLIILPFLTIPKTDFVLLWVVALLSKPQVIII